MVDRIAKDSKDLSEEQQNELTILKAKDTLEQLLRAALKRGSSGAFGIRIPLQRRKLGNIRQLIEEEL